jgi:hypothetical protein
VIVHLSLRRVDRRLVTKPAEPTTHKDVAAKDTAARDTAAKDMAALTQRNFLLV